MSTQRDITPMDEFDEDSVFNRVLSPAKPDTHNSPANRLERIFAEAPVPQETIDARDFLPIYAE